MNNGRRISAIILAAGLGERMMPLTAKVPKPLLPVLGVPLLEILVPRLVRLGAAEVHCNLFHLSAAIESFAADKGWPLRFHRERELLGTGGGIGNMADDLSGSDAILLHNGDILSDLGYESALAVHGARGALVTLILVPRGPRANVAVNGRGEVIVIGDDAGAYGNTARLLGYTGLAVLAPESLAFFPRGEKSGLLAVLREMMRTRPGSVLGWNAAPERAPYAWGETGSAAGYLAVHRDILVGKARFDPALEPPPLPLHAGDGAVVEPGAVWKGFCEIGRRAVIERGAVLEDCVVLDDTLVRGGAVHRNEILFPGGSLKAGGDS